MSKCTINPVKTYLAYSRLLDVNETVEGCFGLYSFNPARGKDIAVSPHTSQCQERVVHGRFITSKVGKSVIGYEKAQLMSISKTPSAAQVADAQLNEPVPSPADNLSEAGSEEDDGHQEPIWHPQDLTD